MIDFHTHLLFISELRNSTEQWEPVRKTFITEDGLPWPPSSIEETINRMNVADVDYAVILPIDCKREKGAQILTNEEVREISPSIIEKSLSDKILFGSNHPRVRISDI